MENKFGNIQSVSTEDDAVMDDAGGNEGLNEDKDEDGASHEDSSSFTTQQAPTNAAQGHYTGAILWANS